MIKRNMSMSDLVKVRDNLSVMQEYVHNAIENYPNEWVNGLAGMSYKIVSDGSEYVGKLLSRAHSRPINRVAPMYQDYHTVPLKDRVDGTIFSTNTTGYRGVSKTRHGTYRAQICYKGVKYHIGNYDTALKAYVAYLSKIDELMRKEGVPA